MKKKNIFISKIFKFFFAIIILLFVNFNFLIAGTVKTYEASFKEIQIDKNISQIGKMIWSNDKFYILDTENHRIIRFKDNKAIGNFGMIGNTKGELFHPMDFCMDNNSNFFIIDKGNKRIQILESSAKYVGEFPENPKAYSIAVNSKQHVFLAQPLLKKLVSVYNLKGKRILKFGKTIKPSEFYGEDKKKYDKKYMLAMNRTHVAVDKDDNIWVVFFHMPIICKYDHNGELILKKTLDIPDQEPLKKAIWQDPSPQEYISIGEDGVTMTMIVRGITYAPGKDQLYLLFGDNRIVILNSKAEEKIIIEPKIVKGAIEKMCINDRNEIFVSFFFSNIIYKLIIEDKL